MTNLDKIQKHLDNIYQLASLALDDLDAAKYDDVMGLMLEISDRVNSAVRIMEDNEGDFQE